MANSSGQVGRNLCDHLYGESARGYLPQLLGQPSFPDHVADSTIAWMPRWQNLKDPHEEKFIRGYSVYPDGGCGEFPGFATDLDGFGSSFKREIKRRYPTPVSFGIQAPSLRSDTNFVDLDPEVKDPYGIPVARMHFEWDENVLKMWEHSKQVCAEVLRAAGGEFEGSGDEPEIPGFSLHETGTCRMGNDPKKFVTNRFGQTHDVRESLCVRRQRISELHRQDHDDQHSRVLAADVRASDREFPARRAQGGVNHNTTPAAEVPPHASAKSSRLCELTPLFLKLGATSFGGPAAHIAMMESEVVRKRQWLTRQQFLDMLGRANLIPGPTSTEIAINVGFVRAGWTGLCVAGASFILPAALITGVFAWA